MSSNGNIALREKFTASRNTCFSSLGQATCASIEESLLSKLLVHRYRATTSRNRAKQKAFVRLASVFRCYNTFRHAVLSIHLRAALRGVTAAATALVQEALLAGGCMYKRR